MAEMVTVGGIRYRKEDAAKEGFTPDSKAHQKRVAEGEAPVGVTEAVFKASQKASGNDEDNTRKAAGGRPRGRAANAPLGSSLQGAGTGGDASDVDNKGNSTAGQNPEGDASNAGDK